MSPHTPARTQGWMPSVIMDAYMASIMPSLGQLEPITEREHLYIPAYYVIHVPAGTVQFPNLTYLRPEDIVDLEEAKNIHVVYNLPNLHWAYMHITKGICIHSPCMLSSVCSARARAARVRLARPALTLSLVSSCVAASVGKALAIYETATLIRKHHAQALLSGLAAKMSEEQASYTINFVPRSCLAAQHDSKSCGLLSCIIPTHILLGHTLKGDVSDEELKLWRAYVAHCALERCKDEPDESGRKSAVVIETINLLNETGAATMGTGDGSGSTEIEEVY